MDYRKATKTLLLSTLLSVIGAGAKKNAEPRCGTGEHWVTAHHRRGYSKANGTWVKETDVRAHCQKNPTGFNEWNPKLANGAPKHWGTPNVAPGAWTEEERERVLEALAEIPEFLKNQGFDDIYRMHNSGDPDNPAGTQGTNIVLYDAAFGGKHNLAEVLAHEMAHRYYSGLSPAEQKSFRDAAKWIPDSSSPSGFKPGRPANQFIRPNGLRSFHEDFADDVANYALNPTRLRTLSPEVFNWMEHHIGPKMRSGSIK